MAATLQQILLGPGTRPQVIADCYALIQEEISEQSGVSGTAVKLAYKTVNTLMPGHIRTMVDKLLPEMVDQLQPFWADFSSCGGPGFGDYLPQHGGQVAQALLAVTDTKAASSGRPVIVKAYGSVRGSAARHIEAALPRVGDLVMRYAD